MTKLQHDSQILWSADLKKKTKNSEPRSKLLTLWSAQRKDQVENEVQVTDLIAGKLRYISQPQTRPLTWVSCASGN